MIPARGLALATRSALRRNSRSGGGGREPVTGGNLGNRFLRQRRWRGVDGLQEAPAFQRFVHAAASAFVAGCGLMRRAIASVRRIASAFALSNPDTSDGGSSSSVV